MSQLFLPLITSAKIGKAITTRFITVLLHGRNLVFVKIAAIMPQRIVATTLKDFGAEGAQLLF
ncbi:MAG: hypothetical protein ABIH92_05890, partial [Nanoarchaeota archaeon]